MVKKKIVLLLVCLAAGFLIAFLSVWALFEIFHAEPTIMETYISPDGEYAAYVFESNGGATTGWIYHVSVLPSDKKLRKGNGNVYVSDIPPEALTWIDDRTLYVDDYANTRTTKRKEKIYNIKVIFNSLEKERSR